MHIYSVSIKIIEHSLWFYKMFMYSSSIKFSMHMGYIKFIYIVALLDIYMYA